MGAVQQVQPHAPDVVLDRDEAGVQGGRRPRVGPDRDLLAPPPDPAAGDPLLVGDQLGLDDQPGRPVDRLDLVADRHHRAMGEGDQPGGPHLHRPVSGRPPLDDPVQGAGAQVQPPLVPVHVPVADVEGLVVHQQSDDLPVGDVDHRLAGLGIAVRGLGVRQRAPFVHGVEVGARDTVRLALLEVAAQPHVTVRQREHRLGPGEVLQVELGLPDAPGFHEERGDRLGVARHRRADRLLGSDVLVEDRARGLDQAVHGCSRRSSRSIRQRVMTRYPSRIPDRVRRRACGCQPVTTAGPRGPRRRCPRRWRAARRHDPPGPPRRRGRTRRPAPPPPRRARPRRRLRRRR